MIAMIDYGAGNLGSVEKALRHIGAPCTTTADPAMLSQADGLVLPGVGAFGTAMTQLETRGVIPAIQAAVKAGTPLLGICLGMQVLFSGSEEAPGVPGLGLIQGRVLRFPAAEGLKIPHMGWNTLQFPKESPLFAGLSVDPAVYFVHSYYVQAQEPVVTATADYGVTIDAAVQKGNLFACQFHPEKSGEVGIHILRQFVSICKGGGKLV